MLEFAYYPGCILQSTARPYNDSLRLIMERLEVRLQEVPDWNCCGGDSAQVIDKDLAVGLVARNLNQAASLNLDIFAPCAVCYKHLISEKKHLQDNPLARKKMEAFYETSFESLPRVYNAVELLTNEGLIEKISYIARKTLSGLKIVAYYGCLLQNNDSEKTQGLERLINALGGESLPWPYKTECCGGSYNNTDEKIKKHLVKRIVDMARECGADAIVTACPHCHTNLDFRQYQLKKEEYHREVPIFYLSQLIGLALGLDPHALGLLKHFISTEHALFIAGIR